MLRYHRLKDFLRCLALSYSDEKPVRPGIMMRKGEYLAAGQRESIQDIYRKNWSAQDAPLCLPALQGLLQVAEARAASTPLAIPWPRGGNNTEHRSASKNQIRICGV